jgi:RND family efflux transporter MFP subunit
MRKHLKYTLPLGLFVLSIVVFAGLVAVGQSQKPERKEEGRQAVLVDVIEAEERMVSFTITSQGSVRPRTETTLVAEVSGKITSVSSDFIAGGFFTAGEELLVIDPSDYQTALKRAEANLAAQKAKLAEENARSEQALRDWRNLGRTGEPSELVLRKPQVQEAIASVQAAEADVEKARRDLERTRISVPYDGLVKQKLVDIGQFVAPGTQLGVTFAIDAAEIRLPLSPDDVAYLDLPSATGGTEDAYPRVMLSVEEAGMRREWEASIVRTEGVVDEISRVIYAVAQVVDPYGVLGQNTQDELKVGTFVRAEIEGRSAGRVVVLPRRALQQDNTVLVANDQKELEVRPVNVVRAEPRLVYISDGVRDGEKIVITTLEAPIPGMKLAINGEEEPAPELMPDAAEAVAGTDGESE